ncbi:MAG: MFS transporter, partial [Microbacterium gubbeenense]
MTGMFRSLRVFNYRMWFAGALVSNVGTWMQSTAQDWVVHTELTNHDA